MSGELPLVSRFGMMLSKPSQDTLGPIARTVKDAAILLDAIAGYDPNDPVTAYKSAKRSQTARAPGEPVGNRMSPSHTTRRGGRSIPG